MNKVLLGLVLCVGISGKVYAQTIPQDSLQKQQIDSLRQENQLLRKELAKLQQKKVSPLKKITKYSLSAEGFFSRGNVERNLITTRASLSINPEWVEFEINPRYSYGDQNGVVAERDFFSDIHLSLFPKHTFYGLSFGIAEVSNLRNIELRWLSGIGLGIHILHKPNAYFSITNALIYESTTFVEDEEILTVRNSMRFKGKYSFFQKKLSFRHVIFIQPSLQDADNYRWNANFKLELPLTKYFGITSNLDSSYESIVAEGKKNNDTRWTIGFVLKN